MNSNLSETLRGFQVPAVTPLPADHLLVARLIGLDFRRIFDSSECSFESALDARFAKAMVRTTSHLLGGDACGRYGYTELTEFSILLDTPNAVSRYTDATDLQNYLVGMASAIMTQQVQAPVLFVCRLYAFDAPDLVMAYFSWRQQEAYLRTLDDYCSYVLSESEGASTERATLLLAGMGQDEKEEILQQNDVDYEQVPAWQRNGTAVSLLGEKIAVETDLPRGEAYERFLEQIVRQDVP